MSNSKISSVIAKGIKQAKWITIEYSNRQGEITYYWIAIHDILISKKQLVVDAFNVTKMNQDSDGILAGVPIDFERIQSAALLPQTSYKQNEKLIEKVELHLEQLAWLKYDEFNDEILDYIELCVKHEEVSYQDETIMLEGVDHEALMSFKEQTKFPLTLIQSATLISGIEYLSNLEEKRKYYEVTLALNMLSINTKRGLFVVAYKEATFDPVGRTLVLGEDIIFNYNFKDKGAEKPFANLRNYLDIETDYFTELYLEDAKAATDLLMTEVAKYGESVDDLPHFMNLVRRYDNVIAEELSAIKHRKALGTLNVPLEAFFGNMSTKLLRRSRAVDVMLLDEKANIDQLRVIYNALVQPITYVQGPPGTGKTQTIINILISAFFNKQTVLVSTNNNKPIDDIYMKMTSIKAPDYNTNIPLPILRLGNKERVLEALDNMQALIKWSEYYDVHEEKLARHLLHNKDKAREINRLLSDYQDRIELLENIETMEKFLKTDDLTLSTRVQILISENKERLAKIPYVYEDEIHAMLKKADATFFTWLFFTSVKHIKRLKEPKYEKLHEILKAEDEDEKFKAFNNFTANAENLKLLQRVFPLILTTNQSAYRLGPQGENFDLTIIDEAGQSSIGYALYPMSRAKRLLLVGDNNQLRPVVTVPPETNNALFSKYYIAEAYNYVTNSILRTMQKLDNISKTVILRYHYRSRKQIVEFSNRKYYGGKLKFMRTDESPKALTFIDIDNSPTNRPIDNNYNEKEIAAIIAHIKSNKAQNVGVITPFVNQAAYLKDSLVQAGLSNVEVGTVHKFQGDEKNVIYFSTSISKHTSDGAFEWVKDNDELINVALTRARDRFVLVTDYKDIKRRSDVNNNLIELLEYVKSNGLTVEDLTTDEDFARRKHLKSKREEELLQTITQVLSMGNYRYQVETHVKVSSILDLYTTPEKFNYGLKAEFDFVIFKVVRNQKTPVLVIELDGPEHTAVKRRRYNDKLKEKICADNNIIIRRIPNDYSRRYLFVKEFLKSVLT
ncbi:MAG TPA: AAA domain-containing protein [Bacilli bacterium]|nr:AAA domain-containing protein [Bacilli bacterium]